MSAKPQSASTWRRSALTWLQYLVVMSAFIWLIMRGAEAMGYNWQWYRMPRYFWREIDGEIIWGPFVLGAIESLRIAAISFFLAAFIGLVTALMRLSPFVVARGLSRIYMEVIRNTPILVQLYLFYYVFGPIFGYDRFTAGVLALSFFEGAYASEIFRAGILSVARGQWEAADSIGLSRRDTYRFVVLPQAMRLMLPPMASLAINLVKHSAIVSVIAVAELTTEARNLIADTYMSFEIWFTIAGIYLAITLCMSVCASYLEKRYQITR